MAKFVDGSTINACAGVKQNPGEAYRQRSVGQLVCEPKPNWRENDADGSDERCGPIAHDALTQPQQGADTRRQAHGQKPDRGGLDHRQAQSEDQQGDRKNPAACAGQGQYCPDDCAYPCSKELVLKHGWQWNNYTALIGTFR